MAMQRIGLAVWLTALTAGSLVLAQGDAETAAAQGRGVTVMMDDARTISVAGTGRVSAAPDVADINIGVVTQARTAREALSANNEAMEALLNTVKERGVAAKDVQTSGLNINPQYSQPRGQPGQFGGQEGFRPEIYAYEVTNTVQVTARDLTKLGELLDAVVSAGANRMNGISFRIEDSEALLDQCRKKAMADAKRKAEMLAREADVVLGPPISIAEQGAYPPPPRPMMMMRAEMAMAPVSVPIASGEQELTLTVNVTYELKPAK